MKIREALEIVERAKETAEKIIIRVYNKRYGVGECEDIEDRCNGMIYFQFVYLSQCGHQYNYPLEIPVVLLDDPTEDHIEEFLVTLDKAKKREEARLAEIKKRENKAAAINNKKKRFETYQKLQEEFSNDN